jgi:hypothetical protein
MRREFVVQHPLYEVEQCPAENIRIYRVQGLRLYDEQEEKNNGPVIDLVRSLPGVAQATFKDCHTFVVRRSLRVTWRDAQPQIVNLLQGVAACSDGSKEQLEEVAVAILRSAERRML